MTSGGLIRQARKRAGLTQAELAERAGTTQSAIVERLQSLVGACGLELQHGLASENTDDLAALRRNLALSVDDRVRRVVRLHRFVAAGQRAMASSRPEA